MVEKLGKYMLLLKCRNSTSLQILQIKHFVLSMNEKKLNVYLIENAEKKKPEV